MASAKKSSPTSSGYIGRLLNGRYLLTVEFVESPLAWMFKASDVNLRREVAVKMLRPHLQDDTEFLERFENQAKKAAQLNHANIASFYNWGVEESPYIVTELCRGQSLRKMIETCREEGKQEKYITGALFKGGLNPLQVISIGKQAAESLAYAHSKGFIHHNINPSNILFDLEGNVKLTDFEISSLFQSKAPPSISESLLGDGFYSPPEGLSFETEGTQPISEKADIFSLGLVLLEAAIGIPPFDESSQIDSYINRLYSQIKIPEELEDFGDVLNLTLKADPTQRPSATELVWHLSGLLPKTKTEIILPLQISKVMLSQSKVNWKKYAPILETPRERRSAEGVEKKISAEGEIAAVGIIEEPAVGIVEKIQAGNFLSAEPIEISKSHKISKVGLVCAVLSLLAISIVTIISLDDRFGSNSVQNNLVSVPNVVGLSQAEAAQMLDDFWEVRSLSLRIENVEIGAVASTNPPAGQSLKRGEVISITTSLGDPLVLLPASFLGQTLETIVPRLEGIGLGLGQIYQRQGERLIPIETSEANFAQDILVGFNDSPGNEVNESLGEVKWGSKVSVIVIKP